MGKRLALGSTLALAIIFFIASFLILYHQKVTFGTWFESNQVLHHDVFALVLAAFGAGLILGSVVYAELARD